MWCCVAGKVGLLLNFWPLKTPGVAEGLRQLGMDPVPWGKGGCQLETWHQSLLWGSVAAA